jgi:heme o synthase
MTTLIKRQNVLRLYYTLTKPGIVMGNAITAASGFILASKGNVLILPLFTMLMGLSFIMASACVFNNYIDRFVDEKMARTKNRALVRGLIPVKNALVFATFLGVFGTLILALSTNLLTVFVAIGGFIVYLALYSVCKYHTTLGTVIGSISGAVPPLAGYLAAANHFDAGSLILFFIVALWQMPHFFAIALYRLDEYLTASIPVLPAKKGAYITKIHMLLYIIAFTIAASMLTFFGYTGYFCLATACSLGLLWLWQCIKGFKCANDKLWGRQMFLNSLAVITLLSLAISLDVA